MTSEATEKILDQFGKSSPGSYKFMKRSPLIMGYLTNLSRNDLSVLRTIQNLQVDESNFYFKKALVESRVATIVLFALKHSDFKIAMLFHFFYFFLGFVDRKKAAYLKEVESFVAEAIQIDRVYFDIFDLLANKGEFLQNVVHFFKAKVNANDEFLKIPCLKKALKFVLKFKLLSNLNRIRGNKNADFSYLNALLPDKKLAKLFYFLLQLKGKVSKSSAGIFTLNEKHYFTHKFKLDIDELCLWFKICKKIPLSGPLEDWLFNFEDGEKAKVVENYLYIQSNSLRQETNFPRKNLGSLLAFFEVNNLSPVIFFRAILLQKCEFSELKILLQEEHFSNSHGISNLDLLLHLIGLRNSVPIKLNKNLLRPLVDQTNIQSRSELLGLFGFPKNCTLAFSPLLYLLLNAGEKSPEVVKSKFLYFYRPSKTLNFWNLFIYLNFKRFDVFKLEFFFDLVFLKKLCLFYNSFKDEKRKQMKTKKNLQLIKFFEERLKTYLETFEQMFSSKELFATFSQLSRSMNAAEKLLFDKLTKSARLEHPLLSQDEIIFLLINKHILGVWQSKTKDEKLKDILGHILLNETLKSSIVDYITVPTKDDNIYWEPLVSSNFYVRNFYKLLLDEIIGAIATLNFSVGQTNSKEISSEENSCPAKDWHLDLGFYALLLTHRLSLFEVKTTENAAANFSAILLCVDILFKMLEKTNLFCKCSLFTGKMELVKFYLMSMGVVLNEPHLTTFSAEIFGPLNFVYFLQKLEKLGQKITPRNFLASQKTMDSFTLLLAKMKLLRRIFIKDGGWREINGIFRNFFFERESKELDAWGLAFEVNIKLPFQFSIDRTNLFDQTQKFDSSLIRNFYLNDEVCAFANHDKTDFYERTNKSFLDPEYFQLQIIKFGEIKEKFRPFDLTGLVEFYFGKPFENTKYWRNLKEMSRSYFNFSRKKETIIFTVDNIQAKETHQLQTAQSRQDVLQALKVVSLLQASQKEFQESALVSAVTLQQEKLKSSSTLLIALLEFLLSKRYKGKIIRQFPAVRNSWHQGKRSGRIPQARRLS